MMRTLTGMAVLVLVLAACGDTGPGVEGTSLLSSDSDTDAPTEVTGVTEHPPTETSGSGTGDSPPESPSTSGSVTEATQASTPSTVTGATPATPAAPTTTPTPATPTTKSPDPPPVPDTAQPPGGAFDSSLTPLVDLAVADLSSRMGVDPSQITVVSAELVEWSDASLGCPQPGMVYAQVPTDGSLIRLSAGGTEYRYHTGGNTYTPFLCER